MGFVKMGVQRRHDMKGITGRSPYPLSAPGWIHQFHTGRTQNKQTRWSEQGRHCSIQSGQFVTGLKRHIGFVAFPVVPNELGFVRASL